MIRVKPTLTLESAEAQALRHKLATLGKSWVGLPLYADKFLGSQAATLGARIYAAQRLIDLTDPAIVAHNATLDASHTYAPLVVGHIQKLPIFEPLSGGLAKVTVTIFEDSPWVFRITSTILPASGTWPETLLPDWTSPPTQAPVHGLEFGRIGQQREQTIAGEERAFRWMMDAGFTPTSKAEIATLIGFFISSRGPWTPFTSPLWFEPGEATAEAPHETKVRFESPKLEIEYETDRLASARVNFAQVPWEITGTEGEAPEQPPRIFLYEITYDVPTPVVWRFTNCWRPLTRTADGTYAPAPMQHDAISAGLKLQNERLTLESFLFDGNPLALFNPNVLEGRLWLRVYEIATDPIDADAAALVWTGTITAAPQTGRKFAAQCEWLGGLLDRELPNVRIGPRCNTHLFSSRCGHLKADFEKAGTFSSAAGNAIVVAVADAATANTYAPGTVEIGAGLTYESRSIVASEPVDGGQRLTLDRPLRQAPVGQAITYFRGCDLSLAACQALDPAGWKARFRGHPFVPQVNLSLPQVRTETPTKK